MTVAVRTATAADRPAVWSIIEPIVRAGETYTLPRNMSQDDALAYWFGADKQTFVAEDDGAVLGSYYLRANQAGGGAHVANCGYATAASESGKGVATAMAGHSFEAARKAGFRAMQFNFVVSSNLRAVELWQRLGFDIVGRLPDAFAHPIEGEIDALVMYRFL